LHTRRLIQKLEEHLVQLGVFLNAIRLYEFDESGEGGFGVHHLEDGIVLAVAAIV
jgi:hypothetical protein